MGRFFASWATWEKLVFILGCAIVVTVFLGCTKLAYAHMKLRQYAALAEKEKQEQGLQRQRSQRRKASGSEGEDVPFGSRALDRGQAVEGIWYSRSNTPEPASRPNSQESSTWSHLPRKDYEVDLERQECITLHDRPVSNSTTGIAVPGSSRLDGVASAEPLHGRAPSRDCSPDKPLPKASKSRLPPSSLSKFAGHPYLLRQDPATSTLQALDSIYHASGPMSEHDGYSGEDTVGSNYSSNQSSSDTADTEPISASAPNLLTHQPRQSRLSTDLDLMHSHRMSQAAETGQLTPRVRKTSDPGEYFTRGTDRSRSPTERPSNMLVDSQTAFTTPKIDSLPPAVRQTSLPDVTSFAKFCQTAPLSPQQRFYRPVSAGSEQPSRFRRKSDETHNSVPLNHTRTTPLAELAGSLSSGASQSTGDKDAATDHKSFEHRASNVIRGLGTGFEILRPGTLDQLKPVAQPEERQNAGPPISMLNESSRSRSSSTDSRRKLHKKRRPSVDSQTSDFGRGTRASFT